MASKDPQESADLTKGAQSYLERWLLSPELQQYMRQAPEMPRKITTTGPYVAISREAGAGATDVAREVGRQLGWDVLDKQLLDFIAHRYKVPRDMLDVVDEARANWFHDVLGVFLDSRVVSQDTFVAHLERIVHLAALRGKVVFIGRGAQYMLPDACGLTIRIVAPKARRIENMMRLRNLSRAEATRWVEDKDAERAEFCRRNFHRDVHDPLEYSLVVNSERLSVAAIAEVIVTAVRHTLASSHDRPPTADE